MTLEKVICTTCGKRENKKATMDGVCVSCWNKRPKLFDVKKAEREWLKND